MTLFTYTAGKLVSPTAIFLIAAAFSLPQGMFGQDRDYEHRDYQTRRLDPGTLINVKADQPIDSHEGDRANFRGFVTDDVRTDNGRLVIPAGSPVRIGVRVMPDNDLRLALRSVDIRGEDHSVDTDPMHVEAHQQGGVIGGILGVLSDGQIGARDVHIPRGAILTFHLESSLITGPPDRDYNPDRDRYHETR